MAWISYRLEQHLVRLGLSAMPALFVAGITVNAAPAVLHAFEGVLCPAGTQMHTGYQPVPHARTGVEGSATCIDAAGAAHGEPMFFGFLGLFVVVTLTVFAIATLLRNRPVSSR